MSGFLLPAARQCLRKSIPRPQSSPFSQRGSSACFSQAPQKKLVGIFGAITAVSLTTLVGLWSLPEPLKIAWTEPPIPSADHRYAQPWSTFNLAARQQISPTVSIFTFQSIQDKRFMREPDLASTYYDSSFESSIFAVDVAQPQLQIKREYTPLPPAIDPETGKPYIHSDPPELHLLVRREDRGEVSNYIFGLREGDAVRISKPETQVKLAALGSAREAKGVVMVVGGTGITAALQAAHAVLETRTAPGPGIVADKPQVHILWANRRREDCMGGVSDTPAPKGWLGGLTAAKVPETELGVSPVVDELKRLKAVHGDKLKVDYFVDEEGTRVSGHAVAQALHAMPDGVAYVAVSGPEGFMNAFCGENRRLRNKITERPLEGELKNVARNNWKLMVLG